MKACKRKQFVMFLLQPDMWDEYKRRHDELWPAMWDMLKKHGVKTFTISNIPGTVTLVAYMEHESDELLAASAKTPINQEWWAFMADIMETEDDNTPVSVTLWEGFHFCPEEEEIAA